MRILLSGFGLRRAVAALVAAFVGALVASSTPALLRAQIRPSIDAEVFIQWPSLDTRIINTGWWHGAIGVSAPLLQRGAFAWVASAQLASVLVQSGDDLDCLLIPGRPGCTGNQDVMPKGALMTGAAFHDGPLVVRLQAGAARYTREWGKPKVGPQLRLDATVLARGTVGLTISASRAWIGEFLDGDYPGPDKQLGMTSLGLGIRLVPHR